MEDQPTFCAVCGTRVVINDCVHLTADDDSILYMHAGCWLGQGISQMFQAIEILTQGVQTWIEILGDQAVQTAVEAKIVAMAKARKRAEDKPPVPPVPEAHTTFGLMLKNEPAEQAPSIDAVAACPSVSIDGVLG